MIEVSHLWGVVSDDRRTEHRLDKEFQRQAGAAVASLIWHLLHGSKHFLQSRIICQSYTHPKQRHSQMHMEYSSSQFVLTKVRNIHTSSIL